MFKTIQGSNKHFFFLLVLSVLLSIITIKNQHMNNYIIFKNSFVHLWDHLNMYVDYPAEQRDLFKYSPFFALCMAPFVLLPDAIGAVVWNLLGALLLVSALGKMPITEGQRKAVFWLSLPEFIGSTQNFQSNVHMIALILWFYVGLHHSHWWRASLSLFASVFIKIFGVLALMLLPLFATKQRVFNLIWSFGWRSLLVTGAMLLAPALFVGFDSLVFQYEAWFALLKADSSVTYGFSFLQVLHLITTWDFPVTYVQAPAAILLAICVWIARRGGAKTRELALVAVTYFLVVFNHRSESPTFIIPMVGFALHQAHIPNPLLRRLLIGFSLLMVSIFYSDLVPTQFKHSVANLYAFKVWPFLILYPMACYQMLMSSREASVDPALAHNSY